MVDEALYKNIHQAVAARKQNELALVTASENLEQHMNQIEDSHGRVIQREKKAIDQFIAGFTLSQKAIRNGHQARMKGVMADILALKNSINFYSADHDKNNDEMQQLKYQVAQYESILPVYQSRLEDTEELNQRLGHEKTELAKNIRHLKEKLDRAQSLVFSMGTSEAIRQRGPTKHPPASEARTSLFLP